MATEKWVAGAQATYADAFTASTLNSIANSNAILSDIDIDNSSANDMFMQLSIALGSITAASPNYVGFYLYPLHDDGSTYGDGRFASAAAAIPPANYWAASISFVTGTSTVKGETDVFLIPQGHFKIVLYNGSGATLVGSGGNTVKYRTLNRQVA